MATIKVIKLLNRAQQIATDETEINWDMDEWLSCFNEAVLMVANARVDSTSTTQSFPIIAGSKQEIPADGTRFLNIVQNVSTGMPVRKIERRHLDDRGIAWHKKSGLQVNHYIHDPIEPKVFYIYPQPEAGHELELVYQKSPDAIEISDFATDEQVLPVDDIFYNAILNFTLARAYMKDADYIENAQLADKWESKGYNALGVKSKADAGAINANS